MFWERITLAAAGDGDDGRSDGSPQRPLSEIRDLGDFATNWATLRPRMVDYLERGTPPEDVAEIARWLVLLADRACTYEN